jgi:hypothetical protein
MRKINVRFGVSVGGFWTGENPVGAWLCPQSQLRREM